MEFIRNKTPQLEQGPAKSVMTIILWRIKKHRGLTTFIEKNGINGKWLKKDKPYDMFISKLVKIVMLIARYYSTDDFLKEWDALGRMIIQRARNIKHT